jgi:endonuclease/exonuclease/phosphatase family metal-dependent hydrolase
VEQEASTDPPYIHALVQPPGDNASSIAVFVVHPLPARFMTVAGIPIGLDTTKRDADIALIRSMMDAELAQGRPVVMLGDINTTEREPAYSELSSGLRDSHLDAGLGPGLTWGPDRFGFLPFGLLRIDYILVSPEFQPLTSTVNCGLPSDHCRVDATFAY